MLVGGGDVAHRVLEAADGDLHEGENLLLGEIGEPGAPNNARAFLELRIGYRIQELTYGGLSRDTRRTLELLADEVEGKVTRKNMAADPRNPMPGTRLIREWEGTEHTITVLRDGYDWQGRKYRSLSAVAKAITGVNWNGFRFFRLDERLGHHRGSEP